METHIEPPSDWPINSIENLTHNEPYKGRANVAINDGLQGNEAR
jgi:hypothetical protein